MTSNNGADEDALNRSYSVLEPANHAKAEALLKESKQIMDSMGVVFFLRQGTCLGAIRDKGLIPWDDDIDLGSIIGINGLTEEVIDKVVSAFSDSGYFAKVDHNDHEVAVAFMKSSIRTDWTCFRVSGDTISHYPGLRMPASLFTDLKEIDFLDETFNVPNPPEEYLRLKYGADWMTPKQSGYETDILDMIPESSRLGFRHKVKRLLSKTILRGRTANLTVFDGNGHPVADAEVVIAGVGQYRTDGRGQTAFYLPEEEWYAVVIRFPGVEEVLYLEQLAPGKAYVYRPDPSMTSGRQSVLSAK